MWKQKRLCLCGIEFEVRAAKQKFCSSACPCRILERKEWDTQNQERLYAERRALLDKIKLGRGCIDCGYNAHPAALHFDHREPEKKLFKIAQGLCRRLESLLAEVAKCDVRCANCHAVKTIERNEGAKGRKHTDEDRAYLSAVMMGNKNAELRI
jgi:hypothetical protein